ncbi:MAG: SoxR reducing system RseC family protein [Thermodesulfobacteriota bacterium]
MQEEGLVVQTMGGLAQVQTIQQEACKSCGARGACHTLGGDKKRIVAALNQAQAQAGDRVLLSMSRKGVLSASFLVYILPVVALLGGAALGKRLGPGWGWEGQTGAVVLGLASLLVVWWILRKISARLAKRRELTVKVVRILEKGVGDAVEPDTACL